MPANLIIYRKSLNAFRQFTTVKSIHEMKSQFTRRKAQFIEYIISFGIFQGEGLQPDRKIRDRICELRIANCKLFYRLIISASL